MSDRPTSPLRTLTMATPVRLSVTPLLRRVASAVQKGGMTATEFINSLFALAPDLTYF